MDLDDLSALFSKADRFVNRDFHLPKIRLFFQLMALGGGDVENEVYLSRFHTILAANPTFQQIALEAIQYILLSVVGGAQRVKLVDLDSEMYEMCRSNLAYPSAVVSVCNDVRKEDFDQLKILGGEHLECNPDMIKSIEDLCLRLHHTVSISSRDVFLLSQWLEEVHRHDIAKKLDNYARCGRYEDSVSAGTVSSSRLLRRPMQATGGQEGTTHGAKGVLSTFILGAGESGGLNVGRDAPVLKDGVQGSSHLSVQDASQKMERVTSFTKLQNAESQSVETQPPSLHRQLSNTSEQDPTEDECLILQTGHSEKDNKCKLILPPRQMCFQRRSKNRRSLLIMMVAIMACCLVGCVFAGAPIGFGVYSGRYLSFKQRVYATGNKTILVAQFSDELSLTSNSIHECPDNDDYPHTSDLYIVPSNELTKRRYFGGKDHPMPFDQHDPDCTLNLVENDLYLLSDSTIDFRICLTANEEPSRSGTLLIFDNHKSYDDYISQDDCSSFGEAHPHNLIIGKFGHYQCTNISYVAKDNGYHYIIADTPGDIKFYYNYRYLQMYLDPNDFAEQPKCHFFGSKKQCELGAISKTPVYVIASVQPSQVENSPSTHICFVSEWTAGLIALVAVFSLLSVLCCVVAFVLCVCLLYWCYGSKI